MSTDPSDFEANTARLVLKDTELERYQAKLEAERQSLLKNIERLDEQRRQREAQGWDDNNATTVTRLEDIEAAAKDAATHPFENDGGDASSEDWGSATVVTMAPVFADPERERQLQEQARELAKKAEEAARERDLLKVELERLRAEAAQDFSRDARTAVLPGGSVDSTRPRVMPFAIAFGVVLLLAGVLYWWLAPSRPVSQYTLPPTITTVPPTTIEEPKAIEVAPEAVPLPAPLPAFAEPVLPEAKTQTATPPVETPPKLPAVVEPNKGVVKKSMPKKKAKPQSKSLFEVLTDESGAE